MSIDTIELPETQKALVPFQPDMAKIAEYRKAYLDDKGQPLQKADTPEGYEFCRQARREIVSARTSIEAIRVDAKGYYLDMGRRIDAKARELTNEILKIEVPIRAEIDRVDREREEAARAIVEAERRKKEADERLAREAEESRLRAIREAEEAKLRAEAERIAAERQKMEDERRKANEEYAARMKEDRERRAKEDAERKAKQDAIHAENARIAAQQRAEQERINEEARKVRAEQLREQARIESERRKLAEEREKAERAEFEKQARIKAEAEAKEQARRDAEEADKLRKQREEEEKAEQGRIEAAKPDVAKVHALGKYLACMSTEIAQNKAYSIFANKQANDIVATVVTDIARLAERCEKFSLKKTTP